jgi:DNA polymerase II large subunit
MNTTVIIADTLQQQIPATSEIIDSGSLSVWFWIALAEFCIIIMLLLSKKANKNNSDKEKIKQKVMDANVDFTNTIESVFLAKALCDKLKKKCHPDRFVNDLEKTEIATELFQKISKNKSNYKRLLELEEEAKQKLNINF